VQTAGWLLLVCNWRRILTRSGAGAIPFRVHLESHAWSGLGNIVPGSVWMPASRVALYKRLGVPALVVTRAVAVEWLVVGLAGALLYAACVPFASLFSGSLLAALVVAAVAAAPLLHPRALHAALAYAARRLGADPETVSGAEQWGARTLAGLILSQMVVLFLSGLGFYLLMLAVAPAASLADALSASALSVAVANLLAWLPATVLIKDGAMAAALVPLYGSPLAAVAVVVAWRLWMTAVLASWALAASGARRLIGAA
jgi:hypothetical protein